MPIFRRRKSLPEVEPETPPQEFTYVPDAGDESLRPMAEHRDRLLSQVEPLIAFGMSLYDAWGLALCEDITSDMNLPRFDNAQVDGYAVRAIDVSRARVADPITLRVIGTLYAGDATALQMGPREAVRIMAGAPMPLGADAVLPFEVTDRGAGAVRVYVPIDEGANVRPLGSDVADGDVLARQGQVVDSRLIGLLAGVGVDKVLARPHPRVVVISTGAELVEPGRPLTNPAQIYDANLDLIAAAAKAAGALVYRVPAHSDDPDRLRDIVTDQLIRADLIITTGGISEGDADVVKQVMPGMGLTDFADVAIQPGKPQGFGLIGEDKVPVIMLPGNPVSAYVSFEAFVLPVIRRLMGIEQVNNPPVRCVAESIMRSTKGKLQFGRGIVRNDNGRRFVQLVGGHGSHLLGDLARANALVLLPPEVEKVAAGDLVHCWMLDHD